MLLCMCTIVVLGRAGKAEEGLIIGASKLYHFWMKGNVKAGEWGETPWSLLLAFSTKASFTLGGLDKMAATLADDTFKYKFIISNVLFW